MFTLTIYFLIVAIGFMMGFVYKRMHTTVQFVNPDSKTAMRIFLLLLAAAATAAFSLSAFTLHTLNSSNIPEEASIHFLNMKTVVVFVVNVFFLVLLIYVNAYSLVVKKVAFVLYLLVLAFYVIYILADAYYVLDYFALWQKSLQLFQPKLDELQNTARLKCALAAIITFFNMLMIWWGLRK